MDRKTEERVLDNLVSRQQPFYHHIMEKSLRKDTNPLFIYTWAYIYIGYV